MARCFAFLPSVYYITPAPLRAGIMLHNRPDAVTSSTFAEHWRLVTDAAAPLAHVIIHKAFGCFLCSAHVTVMYGDRFQQGFGGEDSISVVDRKFILLPWQT